MHFGKNSPKKEYFIDTETERFILETTVVEKDLGVLVTNNGKQSLQAQTAVLKAHRALGMMRNTFKFFNVKLIKIISIYLTFIRTHVVRYGIQ